MVVDDMRIAAAGPRPAGDVRRFRAFSAALSLAILAISVWHLCFVAGTQPDVSWLLTVCDKMLAGERLYVDVWETNPPFSVYLYMPMAWLGHVTPVSAEAWTLAATYAWVLCFGALALSMARSLGLATAFDGLVLVPAGMYVLVLLAPNAFSQREHFALAGALPMLVMAAWRMERRAAGPVRARWIVLAGLGAAVTMMVKPHYALAFLLPYLLAAWRARSPRVLVAPEVLVAAAVVIAYAAFVWTVHREYLTDVVPVLLDVYTTRESLRTLVLLAGWSQLLLAAVLAVVVVFAPRRNFSLVWSLASGAAGFYGAFLVLGKGWHYHALPAISLILFALAVVAARWLADERERRGAVPVNAMFMAFVGVASFAVSQTVLSWSLFDPPAPVVARLQAAAPGPVVASISSKISTSHPWKRSLHATWLDRDCSDWIVAGGAEKLAEEPGLPAATVRRIEAEMDAAVARKLAAWTARPPDIVFLRADPLPGLRRITENPEFARILAGYRVVYRNGRTEVALRADHLPAWQAAEAR
ncbi:MAG: hypothetical protein Kow0026_18130 [Oricola sp.]